jgi:hypothetical protein
MRGGEEGKGWGRENVDKDSQPLFYLSLLLSPALPLKMAL